MCHLSSVWLAEVLVHRKGNKKLKSRHSHQISRFGVCFNAFKDLYLEAFAGCGLAVSLQTVLGSLIDTYVKYLVNLVKPSNVGWVKEENADIVVVPVPVQESIAVFFLESSLLKHQVCNLSSNFCSMGVLEMRLFVFLLWRSVGSGHFDCVLNSEGSRETLCCTL